MIRLLQEFTVGSKELLEDLELFPTGSSEMERHPFEVLVLTLNVLTHGFEPTLHVPEGLIDVPLVLSHMALKRNEPFIEIGFELVKDLLLFLETLIDLL
jgi:hypothetical protein